MGNSTSNNNNPNQNQIKTNSNLNSNLMQSTNLNSTATDSLNNFNLNKIKKINNNTNHHMNNKKNKRKSLELPDLENYFINEHSKNQNQKINKNLNSFQLKLKFTSKINQNKVENQQEQQPEEDQKLNLNLITSSLDQTQLNSPLPSPSTTDLDQINTNSNSNSNSINSNQLNHNQFHPDSPIISSAPLQQPIETVIAPIPPSILQPFSIPSLDQDPTQINSLPFNSVTSDNLKAATALVQASPALDIGAGPDGVPTLITWKEPANQVFVTGTFCKWKQQIQLRKPNSNDQSNPHDAFSALVALPPGPHQLKFIVDRRWKTSKYLPSATDNKGNLINYLQVNPGDQPFRGLGPRGIWSGYTYGIGFSIGSSSEENHKNDYLNYEDHHDHHSDDEQDWTTEIPIGLLEYEEYHDHSDSEDFHSNNPSSKIKNLNSKDENVQLPLPGQAGFAAEPPKLPAQLREGILNLSSKSPQIASDDNSLLPRPDHSVLNHLAASPIRHGLLSVGVTCRFKRKYLTTVYYKPVDL